jgi:hypothetical protein
MRQRLLNIFLGIVLATGGMSANSGGQQSLGTRATTVSMNFTSPASATTTVYPGVSGLAAFHSMTVFATLANAVGGTLDVYIQMSPDNGTTWIDYCHFTQLASGAAASSKVFTVSKSGQQTTITTVGSGSSPALAAGTVVGGEWGDRLRVVAVAGASTTTGTAETISLILVPTT